jgi:hypothetical protein
VRQEQPGRLRIQRQQHAVVHVARLPRDNAFPDSDDVPTADRRVSGLIDIRDVNHRFNHARTVTPATSDRPGASANRANATPACARVVNPPRRNRRRPPSGNSTLKNHGLCPFTGNNTHRAPNNLPDAASRRPHRSNTDPDTTTTSTVTTIVHAEQNTRHKTDDETPENQRRARKTQRADTAEPTPQRSRTRAHTCPAQPPNKRRRSPTGQCQTSATQHIHPVPPPPARPGTAIPPPAVQHYDATRRCGRDAGGDVPEQYGTSRYAMAFARRKSPDNNGQPMMRR